MVVFLPSFQYFHKCVERKELAEKENYSGFGLQVSLAAADKLHHLILEGNQEAAIKLINKGNGQ